MYGKIDPDYYEDAYLHDARLLDLVESDQMPAIGRS